MNAGRRPPRCDVALLVDEETGTLSRGGRFVPERGSVEERVLRALSRRRRVAVVPFRPSVVETVAQLRDLKPRVVFNLTEWVDGDRRLDAAIGGLLDILGLPYTGAGPDGLRIARDKMLASRVVAGLGVAVPRCRAANASRADAAALGFPLVVKPRFGDGSDGIAAASLVRNARELRARVRAVERRAGEALCEEFVGGRDLYVGLLGSGPVVLPPVELVVRGRGAGAPQLATWRLKHDARYRAKWRVHYRRARLAPQTLRALADASRRIFHALKLRDYARLDFRLTPGGRLCFLEANPNPDLDPHALNRSGCFATVPYGRLLETILDSARSRMK